jgi:hypothetical protein
MVINALFGVRTKGERGAFRCGGERLCDVGLNRAIVGSVSKNEGKIRGRGGNGATRPFWETKRGGADQWRKATRQRASNGSWQQRWVNGLVG